MISSALHRQLKFVLIALVALAVAVFVAGCGDDDSSSTKTGEGAPAGATGDQAGGFAVEAGKQRSEDDVKNENENFKEPPPVQILLGDATGVHVSEPKAIIARSDKEFRALLKRHYSHGVSRDNSNLGAVDFKTRQIVAFFLPLSARGTQLAISEINEDDGKIKIEALKMTRGDGCKAPKQKPRPFHIVETRKMKKLPVEIDLDRQQASPC